MVIDIDSAIEIWLRQLAAEVGETDKASRPSAEPHWNIACNVLDDCGLLGSDGAVGNLVHGVHRHVYRHTTP